MAIGGHQSARMKKDEWITPPSIISDLGPFDLDPCAPIRPPFKIAKRTFIVHDDGLMQRWFGFVWLNPPYGKKTGAWLSRLAAHNNGIALIFARTETKMFIDQVWKKADSVRFIYGRLHFHHVCGKRALANSGAPSVLVGYGSEATARLCSSSIPGKFILLSSGR